jgi:PAS domain S-box-containing protein
VGNSRIDILMVDDDHVDRLAFQRFVTAQNLPYNPTCVGSVAEGLNALRTQSFDVVVTDYHLGDGTAFDLFQDIPRRVPVIVVTGAGHEELAVQAMKSGAADYLIKDSHGQYLKILEVTVANAMKARAAEAALREREEQFRLTFESARDAIFWFDPESGLIIRCNKAAEDLLERTRQEIVGSSVLCLHPPQHASLYAQRFREQVDHGGATDQRAEMICKSGRVIPVEISVSLTTVGGKALLQQIVRDVTDRNRMTRLVCQAQKMEALGTLAGGIAHDFNNILYVIIGFAELALEDSAEGSRLQGNLRQILHAANRAKDVVTQIRAFSRMQDQEKRLIDLGSFIRETVTLLRSSLPSAVEIRCELAPGLVPVLMDPTYIHQILMNLASNAAHAMNEKGGVLKVAAAPVTVGHGGEGSAALHLAAGRYVRLTVSDTGHGMPAEVMDRIFEPYFTTKKPGEGAGLGLAAIHGMVTGEGGTVTVESEPGKGTTFHLFLPVLEQDSWQEDQLPEDAPLGHETLLLIDDDLPVLRMCQQVLEGLGYQVVTRTSSIEAIELFRVRHADFDLVLADMTMPSMTGAQLAWEFSRIRSDIPIIMCTGYSDLIDDHGVLPTGVAAVVSKPIHRSQLAHTIRRVLDDGLTAVAKSSD